MTSVYATISVVFNITNRRGRSVLLLMSTGLMMAAMLSACGDGATTVPPAAIAATTTSVTPGEPTVAQTLQSLAAQGKLPQLDITNSLTGTDANGNGVRDDIDAYIAALTDTAAQKAALTQLGKAIQGTLTVDTTSAPALAATSLALNQAATCVWSVYSTGQSLKVHTLQEISINTQQRLVAYEKYNTARDGAVVPSLSGNTCTTGT
jgi:hypothetical protein